jgi:SAM-dependent methyltransferase
MPKKWFQNWFNSPYYHILYQQRNIAEAEFFIDNLCAYLKPDGDSHLLDIACGRGRHSIYLNKNGFDVTGIDLSIANIQYAKQFENERLHFYVHDMRYLAYINHFDIAFNLFTSFGYFESEGDHIRALKTFRKALKPNGLLVLDFFNCYKIAHVLKLNEIKTLDGIDFNIHKTIDGDHITKRIEFEDQGEHYSFTEEVKAFGVADFKRFFIQSGFEVVHNFGSYKLDEFNLETSDRLIFICRKTND